MLENNSQLNKLGEKLEVLKSLKTSTQEAVNALTNSKWVEAEKEEYAEAQVEITKLLGSLAKKLQGEIDTINEEAETILDQVKDPSKLEKVFGFLKGTNHACKSFPWQK